VVYVCHAPKALLTPYDQKVRSKAWAKKQMTSHWPVLHATLFKSPPLDMKMPQPNLTELGQSLLGLSTEENEEEEHRKPLHCSKHEQIRCIASRPLKNERKPSRVIQGRAKRK